jgi:hypothetical protein
MELVHAIVEALTPLLLTVLTWAGYQLAQWFRTKTKNTVVRDLMNRATDAAIAAVSDVAQTYANEIKAASQDGKLTREECAAAKDKAIEKAKILIGPEGLKVLAKIVGGDQVDEFLGTKVEEAVARGKY